MEKEILYSPWRLQYILSEKGKECIFCIKPSDNNDQKHLILYRSKYCFVIMNLFPYNNGHLMVVPYLHKAKLTDLTIAEINDLFQTVQLTEKVLLSVYEADGINIGMNIGEAAGAGIESHLHVHMVPRWFGDCNFMTAVNGVRVIPESFDEAYYKLKEQFDNESTQK